MMDGEYKFMCFFPVSEKSHCHRQVIIGICKMVFVTIFDGLCVQGIISLDKFVTPHFSVSVNCTGESFHKRFAKKQEIK